MNKTKNEVQTALTVDELKIMSDLNEIGYTLSENDDAFEIENTRKKFN